MSSSYDSADMAAGYARWRPAVHPRVLERVRRRVTRPVRRALDVGCGAGLSTAPLLAWAEQSIGIDPVFTMVQWGRTTAPGAGFAAARAESLPIRSGSIDLITAAGSLNYADLAQFYPEARRVLAPEGTLVVYDFGPGREFPGSARLAGWYAEFERHYPPPACRDLNPQTLGAEPFGLELAGSEDFAVEVTIAPEFYLEYVLTETSVAEAIRSGVPGESIREWCRATLEAVFSGTPHEVIFRGYIAYLTPARRA